ncbi:MAG: hypothetical protein MK179_03195 [Pirellulaceae bacterium]|nr:hypothetical protein [Pirellulaceae bacterium]
MKRLAIYAWLPFFLFLFLFTSVATLFGETAMFEEPDLDRWFHQGQVSPGRKSDPSLFTAFGGPGTDYRAIGPSRSGSMLVGFDTSSKIPQVLPGQYKLTSIQISATITPDFSIVYDPTPDTVTDMIKQSDDIGRPIELFGVGFKNDYEQLGFGQNDGQIPAFEESTALFAMGNIPQERTTNIFPLGDDGQGTGTLGNVFNSPTGVGAYTYNGTTEEWELQSIIRPAWDPEPLAIGTVLGLNPGDNVPANSVFHFDVNLSQSEVLWHFQNQLSLGQLGVFLTSMHDVSGFHAGGGFNPFPKFYAKEHPFVSSGIVSAAKLDIEYKIVHPGDADHDCDVDITDFNALASNFSPSGAGSVVPWFHGNFDGDDDIDITDFDLLASNFAATGYGMEQHLSVPEPFSVGYTFVALLIGWLVFQRPLQQINQSANS